MLVLQAAVLLANTVYGVFAIAELADKRSSSFILLGRRLPKRAILLGYLLLVAASLATVLDV
jgi:hypothetical protein